jgi:hypothetical protein
MTTAAPPQSLPPQPMPPKFAARVANPYKQPAFVGAVVMLVTAALGLNIAVGELRLHFKKTPVPLARLLTLIPQQMGDWIQVSRDEPMEPDLQEVLGTDQYIFRDYIRVSAYGGQCAAAMILGLHAGEPSDRLEAIKTRFMDADPETRIQILQSELKDQSTTHRKAAVGRVQQLFPDAVVNMAVTYYTGMADTVAHIPDRCYIADGFEPTEYTEPTWTLADGRKLEVRFINFQDAADTSRPDRNVAYFFQVNGRYDSDPLGVRRSLQDLFQRYGYYAKVELMTEDHDRDRSAATMTEFLSNTMGELEKSFPDWKKVTAAAGKG